jgi:hypothetical protein
VDKVKSNKSRDSYHKESEVHSNASKRTATFAD